MAVYQPLLLDNKMQNLSVDYLVEILNRSMELNLQQEFIDLIVSEINNKRNTL
jgi:hypothetical protein